MCDYFDNRWYGAALGERDILATPRAVASFTKQYAFEGDPAREWAARLYSNWRRTPMPTGGHFAPIGEPNRLTRDIAAFFAEL